MRPTDCEACDRATTRSAELLVRLRKTAAELHRALNHRHVHWMDCQELPCRENAAAARGSA